MLSRAVTRAARAGAGPTPRGSAPLRPSGSSPHIRTALRRRGREPFKPGPERAWAGRERRGDRGGGGGAAARRPTPARRRGCGVPRRSGAAKRVRGAGAGVGPGAWPPGPRSSRPPVSRRGCLCCRGRSAVRANFRRLAGQRSRDGRGRAGLGSGAPRKATRPTALVPPCRLRLERRGPLRYLADSHALPSLRPAVPRDSHAAAHFCGTSRPACRRHARACPPRASGLAPAVHVSTWVGNAAPDGCSLTSPTLRPARRARPPCPAQASLASVPAGEADSRLVPRPPLAPPSTRPAAPIAAPTHSPLPPPAPRALSPSPTPRSLPTRRRAHGAALYCAQRACARGGRACQASGAKASLTARAVFCGISLTVPASFAGTAWIDPAICPHHTHTHTHRSQHQKSHHTEVTHTHTEVSPSASPPLPCRPPAGDPRPGESGHSRPRTSPRAAPACAFAGARDEARPRLRRPRHVGTDVTGHVACAGRTPARRHCLRAAMQRQRARGAGTRSGAQGRRRGDPRRAREPHRPHVLAGSRRAPRSRRRRARRVRPLARAAAHPHRALMRARRQRRHGQPGRDVGT